MILRSLRWRLLFGAMLAILASLVLAWVVMTLLFARHAERNVVEYLTRSGLQLAAVAPLAPNAADNFRNALDDPRLGSPASGLYWQVTLPTGVTYRSRSLWDQELPTAPDVRASAWRARMITGPFEPRVLAVERRIETSAGSMIVAIAQDAQDLAQARREFGGDLAIFLVLLWAMLTAAAWVQVNLGLSPLKGVRSDVDELRRNPLARIPAGRLVELAPLVEALNALADARAQDLTRARRRAADMAHGLKTPIAALTAQVRRLPKGEPATEGLRRSIAAIRATVEAELAQSRIAGARTEAGLSVAAAPVARQLAAVLAHTDRGHDIEVAIEIDETLAAPVDSADLTEILGAVLENAVRHARGKVRVRGSSGEAIRLHVEDDGEGVPEALRTALLRRGFSRDEAGGSGLGLSIAQGLVEATHGVIALSESELGGLRVELSWPAP